MTLGGKRPGAGRPKGQGKFGEATKAVRVPESMAVEILDYAYHNGYKLPLYSSRIAAGSPVPADEDVQEKIDLNQYLIKHPAQTFLVKVSGDSMINVGIFEGDVLVVDKSLEAKSGKIVIAVIDSQLTVKRLQQVRDRIFLMPENDDYDPIEVAEGSEFHIWGVVTNVIHKL